MPALLAIYNHFVVHTPVTFDIEPRTLAQRQAWLDTFAPAGRHQCFVAARDGRAIGWACSGRFKEKAAYDTSVETSIYLAPGEQGKGLGRRLYQTLFDALAKEDVHRAFGGITLPNEASVGLHWRWAFPRRRVPRSRPQVRSILGRGVVRTDTGLKPPVRPPAAETAGA